MYDDIIDGNDQICSECWWSTGNKSAAAIGHIYCSLYKQDYNEGYRCNSWRHRFTRVASKTETLKNADLKNIKPVKQKINLIKGIVCLRT